MDHYLEPTEWHNQSMLNSEVMWTYFYFMDEETMSKRGDRTCPGHTAAELGLEPRSQDAQFRTLIYELTLKKN